MSDLGLMRVAGATPLPQAGPLRARLEAEQPAQLEHGVHLIVVQSADGSLVVGDSHHYASTPDPFAHEVVDRLILDEFEAVFGRAAPPVVERWTGTYASACRPHGGGRYAGGRRAAGNGDHRGRRLHRLRARRRGVRGFVRRSEIVTDNSLGPFDLVIFDWAGTMVDFGCRAPIAALVEAFARHGVALDEATAREDMGKAKDDHVRALLAIGRASRRPGRRRMARRRTNAAWQL